MERKIGEVFPYKDGYLKAVQESSLYSCDGCHFYDKEIVKCREDETGSCVSNKRSDKTGVVFVEADPSQENTEVETQINNFGIIERMLPQKDDKEHFYFLQIIRRNKDHRGKTDLKSKQIKVFFITSYPQLMEKQKEIIGLCEAYGARAYINLSPKSWVKLHKGLLIKYAVQLGNEQYAHPFKTVNSVAGEITGDQPLWIVDVDSKDDKVLKDAKRKILELHMEYNDIIKHGQPHSIKLTVPTLQGYHIITDPFNVSKFQKMHVSFADVHKNSAGVLLYVPASLSDASAKKFIDQDEI